MSAIILNLGWLMFCNIFRGCSPVILPLCYHQLKTHTECRKAPSPGPWESSTLSDKLVQTLFFVGNDEMTIAGAGYPASGCGLGMDQLHYNVTGNTLWAKQEAGGYTDPNTGYHHHHLPPLIDTSSHSYTPTRSQPQHAGRQSIGFISEIWWLKETLWAPLWRDWESRTMTTTYQNRRKYKAVIRLVRESQCVASSRGMWAIYTSPRRSR